MNIKLIIYHLSFIIRKSFIISKSRGFTLVELAVVTSIIVTLLGFITISLVRSQQTASLTSVQDLLLVDLKQQQLKSMIGDTEGRAESDQYGIHFDSDRYVLFKGTYSSENPENLIVNLEQNFRFNSLGNDVFQKINGELSPTSISNIILEDTTNGIIKTIKINQYGVIKEIN